MRPHDLAAERVVGDHERLAAKRARAQLRACRAVAAITAVAAVAVARGEREVARPEKLRVARVGCAAWRGDGTFLFTGSPV